MARIAYVNGRYIPLAQASVSIEDRGYQFADGIYEVVAIHRGRLLDEIGHLDRLDRSLHELEIAQPMGRAALRIVMRETVRRNGLDEGILYIQVTRGVAKREHGFPHPAVKPALVMTVRAIKPTSEAQLNKGVGVITIPDLRWKRVDIKSVSLLPNILGKEQARRAGAFEAWLVDEGGWVTEGTSTNAWIVTRDGHLITRDASKAILNGITRMALLRLAAKAGLRFEERAFTVAEAKAAREAFLSSSTSWALPVTSIDGASIGNGHPGTVTTDLREAYRREVAGEDSA
jgi:D-alanine transaminase